MFCPGPEAGKPSLEAESRRQWLWKYPERRCAESCWFPCKSCQAEIAGTTSVAVPSSFRHCAGAQFSRFVAFTFLPTWACSFELPFQENLSEGSVLIVE